MIYAGVDIAKMDHVIDAVDESGEQIARSMTFKNNEQGFDRCVSWLESVAKNSSDVVIAMEATGHYWMACFSYLVAHGYAVVVVNPMHVHAVRKIKSLTSIKNDRIDAWLIAETLRIGEYDPTRIATEELQSLKTLTRCRQSLREIIAETKTKVVCLMDAYFPEYAGLFSDMFGSASLALLSKACMPSSIARMQTPSLARLLSEASHGRIGLEKAEEIRAIAKQSVGITLGMDAAAFAIGDYLDTIELLEKKVQRADEQIENLLRKVEPLILTIPGISVVLGSQIVAEIGDINRFKNAASIVKYAGLNSGVSQSGQFEAKGSPITKTGSPYLRRALYLAADGARKYDPNLRAFYEKKRAEGKCHRVAVIAVARKLCHIIYAIMRDKVAYEPDRNALQLQ